VTRAHFPVPASRTPNDFFPALLFSQFIFPGGTHSWVPLSSPRSTFRLWMQQRSSSTLEPDPTPSSPHPQPPPAAAAPASLATDCTTAFFDQLGLSIAVRDWSPPPGNYHGPHQHHIRLASAICSCTHAVLRDRVRLEAQAERTREPVILRQCAFALEVDLISPCIFRAAELAVPLLLDWDYLECDDAELEICGRNCLSCRGASGPRSLSEFDQCEYLREHRGWYNDDRHAATWTGISTSVRALLGRHPLTAPLGQ